MPRIFKKLLIGPWLGPLLLRHPMLLYLDLNVIIYDLIELLTMIVIDQLMLMIFIKDSDLRRILRHNLHGQPLSVTPIPSKLLLLILIVILERL